MNRRIVAVLGALLLAVGIVADVARSAAGAESPRVRLEAAVEELEPAIVGLGSARPGFGVEPAIHPAGRVSRIRLAARAPRVLSTVRLASVRLLSPRRLLRFPRRGVGASAEPH